LEKKLFEKKPGETIVELKGITKRFPGVLANDHIDLDLKVGEVHALLGENGAGKTTLMNILYGLYQPDEGEIYVRGRKVKIRSPKDAINLGIGMVHQIFMLISKFTVTENIVLGLRSSKRPFLDLDRAEKQVAELSKRYGLEVDPKAKIWQLSAGEQQRVEIVKALYRRAQVLILDEPTSVLTPLEVKELISILKRMVREGMTIVFITHKLSEVMAVSDRVTVLRRGKVVMTVETKRTDEESLAKSMVGRRVFLRAPAKKKKMEKKCRRVVIEVRGLQAINDRGLPALRGVSFSIHEGEIFGIAGVSGNGQRELVEVITGLRRASAGKVLINGRDMTNHSPREINEAGVAHVPEERIRVGLVPNFSVSENLMLKCYRDPLFSKGPFLNATAIDRHVEKLISDYKIMTPSKATKAKFLSGGNLQRLILAREVSSKKLHLMVAVNPTSGLDIAATEFIHDTLISLAEKGVAVLLVSGDLDEVISLSDRIAVMFEGKIVGILPREKVKIEKIGLMMTGGNGGRESGKSESDWAHVRS